jgi:hypothetical protein
MTVGELETRMGHGEFLRWARFEAQEPFLPFRVDLIGGLVCSVLANINKGKATPAFSARDFMPLIQAMQEAAAEAEYRKKLHEPADQVEIDLQMAVLRFGGRIVH